MEFIRTKDQKTGEEIELSYKDYGKGRPVVLIHGWPLSKEMWEYQLEPLVSNGFRVIKYDRRGFGKSSKPWTGYDYDALTDDLNALLTQLDLQDVVLIGFSMGGGEVARYFSRYQGARVTKVILISSVLPYLLQTDDNPKGVPGSVFEEMTTKIKQDRIGFLDTFGKQFFGINLLNHPVSAPLLEYYRALASVASPQATLECAASFSKTDFRNEIASIQVPILIIHGDADKTVPIDSSSDLLAAMIPTCEYLVYPGAPHGLFYTHKEELNEDILNFILA